jgi:hypothetical protein
MTATFGKTLRQGILYFSKIEDRFQDLSDLRKFFTAEGAENAEKIREG